MQHHHNSPSPNNYTQFNFVRVTLNLLHSGLVFACLTVFSMGSAQAATALAVDRFSPVNAQDETTLNELTSKLLGLGYVKRALFIAKLNGFPAQYSEDRISTSDFQQLIFLRIEDEMCARTQCLTAVFWNSATPENYVGTAFLTRTFNVSDVIYPICDGCIESYSITFYENKIKNRTLFVFGKTVVF